MSKALSHVKADGSLTMVDVGAKAATERSARAVAQVRMNDEAARALREATLAKGDAFAAAQIAGILAAKRTDELIPLAHPLAIAAVDVTFAWDDARTLRIETRASTVGPTGVEMEAMVAATLAALTIYDMCKALDKGITIEGVRLLEKTGGKSGTWRA
ncbi:MAG: cyclic pyranopterin monophosphate synthase MoaC [Vulcanimicrobiaceae bacterium]|jgi:cyclic pyranopterin phosphate synthase